MKVQAALHGMKIDIPEFSVGDEPASDFSAEDDARAERAMLAAQERRRQRMTANG